MTRSIRSPRRTAALLLVAGVVASIPAAFVSAHAPDPTISSKMWQQDQVVTWTYRSGQVPPAWLQAAVEAAADASNASRASRAAIFSKAAGATSVVAYGEPTGCSSAGIACFSRTGSPTSFSMWFRANGWMFDWGRLSWCQGPDGYANGCFDAQTVALDEFGHVQSLGHHVNYPNQSDYLDAVVQTVTRARPAAGWDAHIYGRCDTARLQLEYDRPAWSSPFSTCLAIATTTSLSGSPTSIRAGENVRFTATLKTTTASANRALSGDPIADRTILLQRRLPGATAWTTIAAMPATTAGAYALNVSPTVTYDWRASFTPAGEGLVRSASAIVRVTVSSCSSSPCPSRTGEAARGVGMKR